MEFCEREREKVRVRERTILNADTHLLLNSIAHISGGDVNYRMFKKDRLILLVEQSLGKCYI